MKELLDTSEMDELLLKLENLPDENQAVLLLKQFNDASADYGKLLRDKNPALGHEEWKKKCEISKSELDLIVKKIRSL